MDSRDPVALLECEGDDRKPLDKHRERTFHDGWEDALESGPYSERYQKTLSWQSLGNRLGCLFGDVPVVMRDELMFWAERQRRRSD